MISDPIKYKFFNKHFDYYFFTFYVSHSPYVFPTTKLTIYCADKRGFKIDRWINWVRWKTYHEWGLGERKKEE